MTPFSSWNIRNVVDKFQLLGSSTEIQAIQNFINSGGGLADWTDATHGPNASPNYNIVFNQNEVQRLDIVIEPDYWEVMQSDLDALMAASGTGFTDESPIYVPCQMYHNGKQWYDVGIRYKGNSSLKNAYQQGNGKLPLRIEMNHFEN